MNLIQRKRRLKELRADIVDEYKHMLPDLCKKYRDIPSDDIRLEVMDTITAHIVKRTKERLHRKIRTKVEKEVIFRDPNESIEAEELLWEVF